MKNIAVITTVRHNPGDDFVREGIIHLLKKAFPNEKLNFNLIHKHSPITTYYGFEWFRYYRLSKYIDKLIPKGILPDKINSADLVIQSGAPVFWCHPGISYCYENEWFVPLIEERLQKFNSKTKFINIAAGTCQRYFSEGEEFFDSPLDLDYISRLMKSVSLTTFRDTLSGKILGKLGHQAPVIPCSSIFAKDELAIEAQEPEYIALNFMAGGAHYEYDQPVDAEKWEREFTNFYKEIKGKENFIFVCHDQKEVNLAKKIDPDARTFLSDDYRDYVKMYSKAKFGIVNRVHAAFMIASFGRPSYVIGNDTRARMLSEIKLENEFVNNVDAKILLDKFNNFQSDYEAYTKTFEMVKAQALSDYLEAFSTLDF